MAKQTKKADKKPSDGKPLDVRRMSLNKEAGFFDMMLTQLEKIDESGTENMDPMSTGFAIRTACYALMVTATHLLRTEWTLFHCSASDMATHGEQWRLELEEHRQDFAAQRKRLVDVLGPNFDGWWDRVVKDNNECSRVNLDESNGMTYSYIVPRFNEDGTHDPVGVRDGPWSR